MTVHPGTKVGIQKTIIGDMNSLDDYNKIEKGKKYKISGSGIRLTYLSLFPVIYEVKEI